MKSSTKLLLSLTYKEKHIFHHFHQWILLGSSKEQNTIMDRIRTRNVVEIPHLINGIHIHPTLVIYNDQKNQTSIMMMMMMMMMMKMSIFVRKLPVWQPTAASRYHPVRKHKKSNTYTHYTHNSWWRQQFQLHYARMEKSYIFLQRANWDIECPLTMQSLQHSGDSWASKGSNQLDNALPLCITLPLWSLPTTSTTSILAMSNQCRLADVSNSTEWTLVARTRDLLTSLLLLSKQKWETGYWTRLFMSTLGTTRRAFPAKIPIWLPLSSRLEMAVVALTLAHQFLGN